MNSIKLVAELHRRQEEMYGGGSIDSVVELLTEDIVWHVPGTSPIAGEHRGVGQVVDYSRNVVGYGLVADLPPRSHLVIAASRLESRPYRVPL